MEIFKYRLKCVLRNKVILFWTLIFPIALGTFFHLAFSNIQEGEMIKTIHVAFVKNEYYELNKEVTDKFLQMAESIEASKGVKLFEVKYTSPNEENKEAKKLLEEDEVIAIIEFNSDKDINLTVKSAGINQTIVKSFLDEYLSISGSLQTINLLSNEKLSLEEQQQLVIDLSTNENYIAQKDRGTNTPNLVLIYFYTLIGLALTYGSFWGTTAITNLQANLSYKGLRVMISPTNRFKLLLINFIAAFIIHFAEIIILLLYLTKVLKVDFGDNTLLILFTCAIGSISGITFGAFICTAFYKASEGAKVGITTLVGLIGGFLSGMMNTNVKYLIQKNVPFLQYINPVNLITDSLYSLYYFPTYERFITNIVSLSILTILFIAGTYFFFRRDKYESI